MGSLSKSLCLVSIIGSVAVVGGCGKKESETKSVLEQSAGTWVQACHATADGSSYIKQDVVISGDSLSLNQTYATDSTCETLLLEQKFVFAMTLGAAVSQPSGSTELTAKVTSLKITSHDDAVTTVYNNGGVCTSDGSTWTTGVERDLSSCDGVGNINQYTIISVDDTKSPAELWLGDCDQEGRDCSVPEKRPTQNQGTRFLKQ